MNVRLDRFLCLDLELTCWEGEPPPGMRPEIVEIGIVEALTGTFETSREGRFLVRPTASEIGAYCTALTGLEPEDVRKNGRPFVEVVRKVAKDFGPARKHLLLWGDDWNAIERECRLADVPNPFPRDNVVDAGAVLALSRGKSGRVGLAEALASFGIPFEGRPHGGLQDARNTVRLFAAMAIRLVR